ncbi:hypothetical protein BDW62DRAFT_117325 [Aspergillus aurantiobrunneus]
MQPNHDSNQDNLDYLHYLDYPDNQNSQDNDPNLVMTAVLPGLFISTSNAAPSTPILKTNKITAVLFLTEDSTNRAWAKAAGIPDSRCKWIPLEGCPTQDLLKHFATICDFIESVAPKSLKWSYSLSQLEDRQDWDTDEAVLVHSSVGQLVAVAAVAAFIMRKYGVLRDQTLRFVQSSSKVRMDEYYSRQLQIWAQVGWRVWEEEKMGRKIPKAPYEEFLVGLVTALMVEASIGHIIHGSHVRGVKRDRGRC